MLIQNLLYLSPTLKVLRQTLDGAGYKSVQIVASDSSFTGIATAVLDDSDLFAAVSILG